MSHRGVSIPQSQSRVKTMPFGMDGNCRLCSVLLLSTTYGLIGEQQRAASRSALARINSESSS
eukprot:2192922-Prymnesium_polylepis.3